MSLTEAVFFVIGLIYSLKLILELSNIIFGLTKTGSGFTYQKGAWAIVTAGAGGLGLGFSEELARKGMNIVIISRDSKNINKIAQKLKENFNVEVLGITQDIEDFPKDPIKTLQNIIEKVKNLDAQILVNNVGVGYVKDFLSSEKVLHVTLALNLFPIVFLSRGFLDLIKGKNKAGIINVSSISAVSPLQRFAIYASTKAFGLIFSQILSAEFSKTINSNGCNVQMLCIQPGMIDTPSTQYIKKKTMILSKNECAIDAINLLGKRTYSSAHWKYALIYIVMNFLVIFAPFIGLKLSENYKH